MEVKWYTARQLEAELTRNDLWNQKYCPITRHRALSITRHPRTSPGDPVLFVGYHKGEVSGYLAIVPDTLYAGEESVKVGWMGSWWSDPEPSNSMMAVLLIMKAYELYEGHLAGFSAADRAEQIFRKSNRFKDFRTAPGIQYLLRFNTGYWIPRKYPGLGRIGGLFRFSDAMMNGAQDARLKRWKSAHKMDSRYSIEYLTQIHDADSIDFIRQHSQSQLTRRNHEDINAMIKYPTSLATVLEDKNKSRYFFSHRSDRFNYLLYKIIDGSQKITAIVLLCADGKQLTAPFVFCREENMNTVLVSVMHHLIAMRMDMFTTYHPNLIKGMNMLKVPYVYRKTRRRDSLISKKIKHEAYIDPYMQDGDGA